MRPVNSDRPPVAAPAASSDRRQRPALGVLRRMAAYCGRGAKPIPRLVALATRALETA